jgi:hypothetical protein
MAFIFWNYSKLFGGSEHPLNNFEQLQKYGCTASEQLCFE